MFAKDFPGGALMLAGANSATSLRSASVKFLFMDEVDAYPPDLDGEGDPIELAKARTRTFHRAKRFYPSTPTVKDASRIEQGFSETDQRYYYVPCPHCGTSQIIEWGRIRWDEQDDSVPAWMECVKGCRIEEHAKTDLLARGEWRATCPEKASTKVVGFHLSALYSPYGWYSWTDARNDFRKAKGPSRSSSSSRTPCSGRAIARRARPHRGAASTAAARTTPAAPSRAGASCSPRAPTCRRTASRWSCAPGAAGMSRGRSITW